MIHSTNRKSKPFNVETVSNLQHCLIPRWYKPANPCSLMLILFLMASLVSSGNAVSYEHAHLVSDTAVNNALPHDAQYIQASKITHDIHHAAYLDKTAVSPELASTHCQQHGMAPQNADTLQNTEVTSSADMGLKACMACCKDECQCSTDHCFNTSATALLQPIMETHVWVTNMAAIAPVLGQYPTLRFGQFRPPKSLFTA